MIINDFNIFCACCCPTEADTILIVDAYAVLTGSIAFEVFEAISRWNFQVFNLVGDFKLPQFAPCDSLDSFKALNTPAISEFFCMLAFKAYDHVCIVTLHVINVKRDYKKNYKKKAPAAWLQVLFFFFVVLKGIILI